MDKARLFTLLILASLTPYVSNVELTPLLETLDAMQIMLTGEEEFDRIYYEELISCMDFIDDSIKPSNDGAWQGMIDYWGTRGSAEDPWGQRDTGYVEYNATSSVLGGMMIYEPCNYASNIAYYYPVTDMCSRFVNGTAFSMPLEFLQSMASSFSQLAMGSSFQHGTRTRLGAQQDGSTLAALAYQFHQASLDPLESSPILHDLDHNYRQFTAFETIANLDNMYTNMPVTEWKGYTDSLFIPDYFLIYSGIIGSIMTLTLPPDVVDAIVPVAAGLFGVSEEIETFMVDFYIPELRNATADLDLGIIQGTRLIGNSIGTLIKLIYAFVWQEAILIDNSIIFTPEANRIGMELLPEVNRVASSLQSFDHFNQDFQDGYDIYPGDMYCNPVIPHPKWHLQSAIGLLDLVYLSDEIYRLLSMMQKNKI